MRDVNRQPTGDGKQGHSLRDMNRQPLADRSRPRDFSDIVGQAHLFGEKGSVTKIVERGYMTNMIFWGPPGTGKTTAAGIIAAKSGMRFHRLNATSASTADIKRVIDESGSIMGANGVLLYLDEIQYFNKKQQQTLLESLEDGSVTLIASTTENPYLYVHHALLSRSVVYEFKPVSPSEVERPVLRALALLNFEEMGDREADVIDLPDAVGVGDEESLTDVGNGDVGEDGVIGVRSKKISRSALRFITETAQGDVRRALNTLEVSYFTADSVITLKDVQAAAPVGVGNFDRDGTVHYDLLSALQKSVRGSDPDAAIFYLARILEGGDLIGACRRLQVMASEDVGAAYPTAAAIVRACVESAFDLGMPEASIPLSNAVIMLATAPKSNSAHIAYELAKADIEAGKGREIPPYMRPSNRYDGYLYPHDYPNHWVKQQYLPDDVADRHYYTFGENKTEQAALAYYKKIREER